MLLCFSIGAKLKQFFSWLVCLQGKLELLTGATPANMKLEVYSKENKLVCKIDNDDAMFGSFPVDDGMRLHVS